MSGSRRNFCGRRSDMGKGSQFATHRGFLSWSRFTDAVTCITKESF